MKVAKAWEVEGIIVPKPYERQIKVLFAPDTQDVNEILFSYAIIPANSKTDYHIHDRPELIVVVSGNGICLSGKEEIPITKDMAVWTEKDEEHQIINTGFEPLKLATVFVPGFPAAANYTRATNAALKASENP